MSGIEDQVTRIPSEWDPDWFLGLIQDGFRLGDSRNVEGIDILVTGTTDETATYAVDSQNVDIGEGLDTKAQLVELRQIVEELEISLNAVKMQKIGLMQRIEELEVDAA